MVKQAWIELIEHYLASEPTPESKRKWHPLEIEQVITQVYNDAIYNICLNSMSYRDSGQLDPYSKAYYVEVQHDTRRDEKYFELPAPTIALPKNRAIRMVAPEKSQEDYFAYTDNNLYAQLNKLDIFLVSNRGRYYVEGNKVFLKKRNNNDIPDKLLVKLVIPFSAFDDDDELSVPMGRGTELYQGIVKLLSGKIPADEINSNNTNTK